MCFFFMCELSFFEDVRSILNTFKFKLKGNRTNVVGLGFGTKPSSGVKRKLFLGYAKKYGINVLQYGFS